MSVAKRRSVMGRPPKPKGEVKSVTFRVRMTEAERELIDRAAQAKGEDTSTWARAALVELATKLTRKR